MPFRDDVVRSPGYDVWPTCSFPTVVVLTPQPAFVVVPSYTSVDSTVGVLRAAFTCLTTVVLG